MLISTLCENFIFFQKIPPPESFALENLEGVPPKKILAMPPLKKILEESQTPDLIFNVMTAINAEGLQYFFVFQQIRLKFGVDWDFGFLI